MPLTNEQKVQLLSEPKLLAVADFLGVESRTKDNNTYWTMTAVVGQSTQRFEVEPLEAGKLKTVKKYGRIIVEYTEFHFQKSGMTVKRAQEILIVE